jgi:hypothetical protein
MDVSGQLHAPVTLPSRKESAVRNKKETGWTHRWCEYGGKENNSCICQESNTRCPARSQSGFDSWQQQGFSFMPSCPDQRQGSLKSIQRVPGGMKLATYLHLVLYGAIPPFLCVSSWCSSQLNTGMFSWYGA